MRKTVLLLEDSRKVGFGGGQKGSLEVLTALLPFFDVLVTDSIPNSLFARKAEAICGQPITKLASFGSQGGGDKASFSIGILELLLYPFLTALNIFKLLRMCKKNEWNRSNAILYAPLKKTLVPAWILSLLCGIPFVYHARNFDNRESIFFTPLHWLLRRARYVLCVSKAVQANLALPQGIHLYNPILLQTQAQPRSIAGKPVITVAAFASLFPWKGLDDLLQSVQHIQDPRRVRIRIYGKGPALAHLQTLVQWDSQILDFTNDVNQLMQNEIDIICMPSVAPEAFGRVPMEGYSFGIPAIATNIGAQAEITLDGETGILVPPHSPRAIADAIDQLLAQPDVYAHMSAQALRHAETFDLKAFEVRVAQIFQGI